LKLKHPINLHKGATAVVVAGLMWHYQNFSIEAWIYLALHGSYGVLWLMKDRLFPDRQWEQPCSIPYGIFVFAFLLLYWVGPFLLISNGWSTPLPALAAAVALNILGVFLHFSSDAQKYFTLQQKSGLITTGFFLRNRNTNYLGEMFIYGGFALTVFHWIPFAILAFVWVGLFLPNMLKKDKSLARYPEFADYKKRSGLFLPKWL
jgi:protein-S-isoprenylcysteine O-methyltransferase Ste14